MTKTIRVSSEYYDWIKRHKRDDETVEETLRRLTRGPHPDEVVGLLTPEEAAELKDSVKRTRKGDRDRKDRARYAFSEQ